MGNHGNLNVSESSVIFYIYVYLWFQRVEAAQNIISDVSDMNDNCTQCVRLSKAMYKLFMKLVVGYKDERIKIY